MPQGYIKLEAFTVYHLWICIGKRRATRSVENSCTLGVWREFSSFVGTSCRPEFWREFEFRIFAVSTGRSSNVFWIKSWWCKWWLWQMNSVTSQHPLRDTAEAVSLRFCCSVPPSPSSRPCIVCFARVGFFFFRYGREWGEVGFLLREKLTEFKLLYYLTFFFTLT